MLLHVIDPRIRGVSTTRCYEYWWNVVADIKIRLYFRKYQVIIFLCFITT